MRRLLWICMAFVCTGSASANFVGIKIENVTDKFVTDTPNSQGESTANTIVFELYANFSNANDTLQNVFNANITASKNFHHALNADDEATSTPLTQNGYNVWGSEVDSFVTIGFKYGGKTGNPGGVSNPVALDPSFDETAFLTGNSIGTNAGWFANPPTSLATKAGTFGDFKILLARFAFTDVQSASVGGSIRLTLKNGGVTTLQTGVLEFFIERPCPAPGALAALLLAPVALRNRRRSE